MADLKATERLDHSFPRRFFLWIDGVGSWLVCLNSRVVIGQASPVSGPIDIPLTADIARIHATLLRDEESYLLESSREVTVNGSLVSKTLLRTGDRLMLGACGMIFLQLVPGCLSAKLLVQGGRRLPMAVDGVLLMDDMIVLGPGEKVHVTMPELEKPLYLFRQNDQVGLRWDSEFSVGEKKSSGRALLSAPVCVSSESFSFALEPVTSRSNR